MVSHDDDDTASKGHSKRRNMAFNFCGQDGAHIFNNTWNQETKPVEMYRTDFISAMKASDHLVLTDNYIKITDSWKQEYDKGVQVPVDIESLPFLQFNVIQHNSENTDIWMLPDNYKIWEPTDCILDQVMNGVVPKPIYDMDEDDINFLKSINLVEDTTQAISEELFETIFTYFDAICQAEMAKKYQKDLTCSIQFDDSIFCEVCKDIYSEPDNEMIFCDLCNICIHQSCYGVPVVPKGEWLCSPCKANCITPICLLCMQDGGAFKSTSKGEWVHIFCALWIPEVHFGSVDTMSPITKIKRIPASRWALTCCFCQERVGACIQCCELSCFVAYHPTCAYINQCHMVTSFGSPEEFDSVENFSYCLKHTPQRINVPPSGHEIVLPTFKTKDAHPLHSNKFKLARSIQREFFNFIDIAEISSILEMKECVIKFIYDYWKEKRMLNGNNPLINLPPMSELVERSFKNSSEKDDGNEIDPFLKLVSLRQDLERARVLCHMTLRREKLKKKMMELYFPLTEFCFHSELQFPLENLVLNPRDFEEGLHPSDDDELLNLSQSSMSKIFGSPIEHDIRSNHSDENSKNESLIVAHEVVLKDDQDIKNEGCLDSDTIAYSYRSSEDPEWQDGGTKSTKRKKKKKELAHKESNQTKSEKTKYTQKITIEFSERSDVASSMDESCNLSTPPASPEFDPPGFVKTSALKRKLDAESSSGHHSLLTPPSPDKDKENLEKNAEPPITPQSNETVTPERSRRPKRHKPNPKYNLFDT